MISRFDLAWVFAAALSTTACAKSHAAPPPPGAQITASSPPPVQTAGAGATSAAGPKAFGEACRADGECAGAVCFHKRIKGLEKEKEQRGVKPAAEEEIGFCSLPCEVDADCPVPMTRGKCGARGMCKKPE